MRGPCNCWYATNRGAGAHPSGFHCWRCNDTGYVLDPPTEPVTAFRVFLPLDGSHRNTVAMTVGAGLPFDQVMADAAVADAVHLGNTQAALAYTVTFEGIAHHLPRIAHRLRACARLRRAGQGEVPPHERPNLERLRDLFREVSEAMTDVLDNTPQPPWGG